MKRVLLCAMDAGGARNLAPLLKPLANRGVSPLLLTSRAQLNLFGESVSLAEKSYLVEGLDSTALEQLIVEFQPFAIICGTTRYASQDRELIVLARGSVKTLAVLDEWFAYRLRFEEKQTGKLIYLPDVIAVQDELARNEAVAEGLPAERIRITGSPALAELTLRAQQLITSPPPRPIFLPDRDERRVVTFLSETHATDYGTSPDAPGPLGSFLGYTEDTVREQILAVMRHLGQSVIFVEKLHPAAQAQTENHTIIGNIDWWTIRQTNLDALLWHSDLVIGMRSMALLEASILGCKAVSFQPGLLTEERCTAVRLGVVPKIETASELEKWIARNEKREPRVIREFPFAPHGAAERVVELAIQ